MRIHLTMKRLVMLSCVMSISPLVTSLSHAADRLVEGVMVVAPGDALGIAAPGAVEDTLKACMARIPAEASAGQRMLAEQGCMSEEEARTSIQSALKF